MQVVGFVDVAAPTAALVGRDSCSCVTTPRTFNDRRSVQVPQLDTPQEAKESHNSTHSRILKSIHTATPDTTRCLHLPELLEFETPPGNKLTGIVWNLVDARGLKAKS